MGNAPSLRVFYIHRRSARRRKVLAHAAAVVENGDGVFVPWACFIAWLVPPATLVSIAMTPSESPGCPSSRATRLLTSCLSCNMAPGAYSKTNAPPPPGYGLPDPGSARGTRARRSAWAAQQSSSPRPEARPRVQRCRSPKQAHSRSRTRRLQEPPRASSPILFPKSVGSRVPTMATAFSALSTAASPLQNRIGGYLLLRSKRRGYALI